MTKPKEKDGYPAARHVAPLRTPADVTQERKRLYRATINGHVNVEDAAKLSYMLGAIRADLESDNPVIEQAENGGFGSNVTVNVVTVPREAFVTPSGGLADAETAQMLWDEHRKREAEAGLPLLPPSRPLLKVLDGEIEDPPRSGAPPAA